ncbi:MAG: hypothetical protein AAGI88_24860 [Pseudomonadota bacterium]
MLLRRVTEHVRAQNWTAVWIDFMIVVVGVFIGIQVANWNDGRASRLDYVQALERARAEISGNLEFIDEQTQAINKSLFVARSGLDALLACADTPQAVQVINAGIVEIRGTRSFQTRTEAIDELTTNPALLSEQSVLVRKRFSELRFFQRLARETSDRYEPITFEVWPTDTPTLAIQEAKNFRTSWLGIEYEVPRYALALDVSVQEACVDKGLLKWFHTWEAWQTNVLVLNQKVRDEYEDTLKLLKELGD